MGGRSCPTETAATALPTGGRTPPAARPQLEKFWIWYICQDLGILGLVKYCWPTEAAVQKCQEGRRVTHSSFLHKCSGLLLPTVKIPKLFPVADHHPVPAVRGPTHWWWLVPTAVQFWQATRPPRGRSSLQRPDQGPPGKCHGFFDSFLHFDGFMVSFRGDKYFFLWNLKVKISLTECCVYILVQNIEFVPFNWTTEWFVG